MSANASTPTAQAHPAPAYRSKTLATWAGFLGGFMGVHRFYLFGLGDAWGWLHVLLSMVGSWGLRRVGEFGQDDQLAWLLVPVLGFTVASAMLQAILIGLTPDEAWHARFNAGLLARDPESALPASGWGAVIGVGLSLMVGATVLMSTIAFSGQRYFEYQIEEARKISQ